MELRKNILSKSASFLNNTDTEFESDTLMDIIEKSIQAKKSLYMKMKNATNWKENEYRITETMEVENEPNMSAVRNKFYDIISETRATSYELYNYLYDLYKL